jgi:L-alanine-DL-glutamate epimerase-like enolase superfamily enzyme
MKITDIETLVLRLPTVADICDGTQDAFLLRVHTDAGVIGLGEADSMPTVLKATFDAPTSNSIGHGLRDLLIGQDPLQIEPLWQRLSEGTLYLGGSGVRLAAISAVEMALWDIAGKVAGRPVCDLLGGAFRRRVRAYASVLFPEDPSDLERVRSTAAQLREQGYSALKFGWGGFGNDRRSDVALVQAARQGAGEDADLLIDVGLRWDALTTLSRARDLAEFRPYWLEAPMPHEPVEAYAEVCASSPVRIACESPGGFWESLHFLQRGHLHVILPDVSTVGGIGQWKRVAEVARNRGAWCVPHNFSTGVLTAASLHVVANQPSTDLIECSESGSPLNHRLVKSDLKSRDGYLTVPETPGLGIELDDEAVARYRIA